MIRLRFRLIGVGFLLGFVCSVYADGGFVSLLEADLYEPQQKAILYCDEQREIMILQVQYKGEAEDFAWLVPLPARPQVQAVEPDKSPFVEISEYTRQRYYWSGGMMGGGDDVEVLERKVAGIYDIAVLKAHDPKALNEWLNGNGYRFPKKHQEVLTHYTQKQWFYVAMRIEPKSLKRAAADQLNSGTLQPIQFTFAADEMIYPLKISSINAGETEILLYLLADTPLMVKDRDRWLDFSFMEYNVTSVWLDETQAQNGIYRKARGSELPLTWQSLQLDPSVELSLTRYQVVYTADKMTDDLAFVPLAPLPYLDAWRGKMDFFSPDSDEYFFLLACYKPEILDEMMAWRMDMAKYLVAGHPKTPTRLLITLAQDPDAYIAASVFSRHHVPQEVYEVLEDDPNYYIKRALSENPTTPGDILRQLSTDSDDNIRFAIPYNPSTPGDILEAYVDDPNREYRSGVARNPNAPIHLLEKLADDEDLWTRQAVAESKRTPAQLLEKLSKDKDSYVRLTVLENPNTPRHVLDYIMEHFNPDDGELIVYSPTIPVDKLSQLVLQRE